ncbi:AbiJ-NTD4 domain-containing protein [Amaricoccus sp.]|uniref:AbiJ-NTD4 domain-containing protein n=1 Tax=Amaricoccus sp. TaxID=1872485 RepID=UPI002C05403B|nr:hypothetical protein [Amaricoccus sp.]HRW16378.1 hypothetical protein [Amaricoccus sp.]
MTSSDFDVRFGFRPPPVDLSVKDMPVSLRNGLWEVTWTTYFSNIFSSHEYSFAYSKEFDYICKRIWFHFFKLPSDELDEDPRIALQFIRDRFFRFQFVDVYKFIEFLARDKSWGFQNGGVKYAKLCNLVLSRERASFRFAETTLVQISDKEQIEEIETAIENTFSKGVSDHIRRAAEIYSSPDRDYRNSIKESISAVEAAVRFVSGKKTVGVARPLKDLGDAFKLHPALRDGFEKLYAFTSDESGIRHALLDESAITQDDARYMLVSCSAFANYLVALKANKDLD